MTPELRGLMATLRRGVNRATHVALVAPVRPKKGRGNKRKKEKEVLLDRPDESSEVGSLERAQKVQRGPVLRSRSQAPFPGLLARPVSIPIPAGGTRKASDNSASSAGDRALNDVVDSLTHQRRRWVMEEINIVTSGSSSSKLPPPLRVSGEGTSRINSGARLSSLRGELEVAREVERQCEAEIEESKKKLAAAEAGKVTIQSNLDSMKEKHRREIEGRDRVLAVVKNKLEQKKKEMAAEIRLQEARARIEALIEYNEGGFDLEAELEHLKDLEVSLEVDYCLPSVLDPSLSCLDLPEISGDSVNQE
ncbi:hypothetical protein HID58_071301 [Brassica napus]|uniref:Uncharacterized protein n=1 Tax=Brassica napus TaxID=3708 RepID=A0ABQ7Z1B0_BRANA|nr:hypothetical protein HID58_071301 [Brassica napus]